MVVVYGVDGSGLPNGSFVGIGSVPEEAFSGDGRLGWVNVALNPLYSQTGIVSAGERYAITLWENLEYCPEAVELEWTEDYPSLPECNVTNTGGYQWGRTTPSAYPGGNALAYSGGAWQVQDEYDFAFKTFVSADTTSPTAETVSPSDGATQVPRYTNVTAKFSEDVEGATVTTNTFMLGKGQLSSSQLTSDTKIASGTSVSYELPTNTATLDSYGSSAAKLARCQWYTAKVASGVKDMAGNPALEKMWSFKTRGC